MTLDIDSEALLTACHCEEVPCTCFPFTTPLRIRFTSESGIVGTEKLSNIRQRKGEAEMAQLDWMMELDAELSDGDYVVNFVSSADTDTVLIHLFGISLHWKRNQSGAFTRPVYVWLQKQKPELYNISKIIESIERYFNKKYSAAFIAIILSMGGNDFLPRHFGISSSLTWKSKRQKSQFHP
ncbi:hypothetical protein ACJMK2_025122 [Sinanodonta woodiana]|uniref:Uncharacterized protein n=1 Tax=Sinanodonta woodiana TaxID=1069815 RepID=A0ABD3XJ65_SINWO